MALSQLIKVAVYESRPFSVMGKDGKTYTGFVNKGFLAGDKPFRFSSEEKLVEHDLGAYDESLAVELLLYGKEYQNEVKWSTTKKTTQK